MSEPSGIYPPKWHPDPFGRHAFRWYDGTRWTEHVSDNSVLSVDPPVSHDVPPVPGQQQAPPAIVVHHRGTNSSAVTSLVMAILWLGGLGALFAVIAGSKAQREIAETGEGGDGMAQLGVVLGLLGLFGAVVFWYMVYRVSQPGYCSGFDC